MLQLVLIFTKNDMMHSDLKLKSTMCNTLLTIVTILLLLIPTIGSCELRSRCGTYPRILL